MRDALRGLKEAESLVCALIVISLPWMVFWSVASGRQVWAGGDISAYHYPLMVQAAAQWRDGRIPLWNPYLYGGTPFAAAQQASVFYPLNIVLWLILPPWLMLGHSILLHLSLAGLSVFLLLRSWRAHPLAALLSGITFEFSGFAMSHIGHVNIIRVLPWPGFILWGFSRWEDSQRCYYLGLVSLATSQMLMSGYPQVIIYCMLFVSTYPLFMFITRRWRGRQFLLSLFALFIGIGISAVQLIPTASMWFAGEYLRPGAGSYDAFTRYSFHPAYLLTMLFPTWRSGTFAEMVGYIGIPPLLLAILGIIKRDKLLNIRRFFAIWVALSLLLAMGRFVPPLARLLFFLPIYSGLAVPSRHLLEFDLSLAILAGLQLEHFFNNDVGLMSGKRWRTTGALLILLTGGWVLLVLASPFSSEIPLIRPILSLKDTGKPILLVLASLILLLGIRRKSGHIRYWLAGLLIIVTVADLVSFGSTIYRRGLTTPDFYTSSPLTARFLSDHSRGSPFRIVAFEAQGNVMDKELGKIALGANYNMAYGIESIIGLDGLMPKVAEQASKGELKPWGYLLPEVVEKPEFRDLLDLWGVRYLVSRADNAASIAKYYTFLTTMKGISIFENQQSYSRLFPAIGPMPPQDSSQLFGTQIRLVGFSLDGNSSELTLKSWWFCQSPIVEDYTLYVHFIDHAGNLLAQDDHLLGERFPGMALPTSRWVCPGYYVDKIFIPPDVVSGEQIYMAVGLWIPETGQRLHPSGDLPIDGYGRTLVKINLVQNSLTVRKVKMLFDEYGRTWEFCPESSCTVRVLQYGGDRVEAEVIFEQEGILVHGTNAVSGWKASVDGNQVPVFRVSGFLQGIYVPPGRHRAVFWYDPESFKVGVGISAVSFALLVSLCIQPARKMTKF